MHEINPHYVIVGQNRKKWVGREMCRRIIDWKGRGSLKGRVMLREETPVVCR